MKAKQTKLYKRPWLYVLIVAFVLLAIVLCVQYAQDSSFRLSSNHDLKVQRLITAARRTNEPVYEKLRLARIILLANGGIISSSSPDYSAKTDVCYVNDQEQGWTSTNWFQDCYVRYVDLFSTALSRQEVADKLSTIPDSQDLFGDMRSNTLSKTCDTLTTENGKPLLGFLDTQLPTPQKDRYECKIPGLIQGVWSVNGPIILDDKLKNFSHSERSFMESDVDTKKHYITLQGDGYYYHEELGCGSPLFCSSPRKQPITDF